MNREVFCGGQLDYPTEIPKEVCKKRSIFIIITTPIITRHTANSQMTNNKYFDKKLQSIYAKEHYMATDKKITFTEEYLLEWKTVSRGLFGEKSMLRSNGGILAKVCIHTCVQCIHPHMGIQGTMHRNI